MDAESLAAELRRQYDNASRNETACRIHLFGIRYARELQSCGVPLKRILELSGVSMGYLSEVSKGIKLAGYVTLKEPEVFEAVQQTEAGAQNTAPAQTIGGKER